jgi:hypothetical protein
MVDLSRFRPEMVLTFSFCQRRLAPTGLFLPRRPPQGPSLCRTCFLAFALLSTPAPKITACLKKGGRLIGRPRCQSPELHEKNQDPAKRPSLRSCGMGSGACRSWMPEFPGRWPASLPARATVSGAMQKFASAETDAASRDLHAGPNRHRRQERGWRIPGLPRRESGRGSKTSPRRRRREAGGVFILTT